MRGLSVAQQAMRRDDRMYAEGVAQHSPGSRQRTLGLRVGFGSPNPNGVLQMAGRRHGTRLPNTEKIVQPRGRANVEPRWGSGEVGWWTAFPGCAAATLGFDVEPRWGSGAVGWANRVPWVRCRDPGL
jgi:hypothetical protein